MNFIDELDGDPSQAGILKFQLYTRPDCIQVLRSMVEVMGLRAKLQVLPINRISLAVDELFANITCHGYQSKPGKVVFEAQLHRADGGSKVLQFVFRDYAPVVNVQDWCCGDDIQPCTENITPGGLGIKLIHSIMHEVKHEALADGNRWTLKYVCKPEEMEDEV